MIAFSTELGVLTCLTLMLGLAWVPYIVGVATEPEAGAPDFTRPVDLTKLRPWVHRAHRAHLNLLEQYVPFAVLVILLALLDGFTALTYWTCIAFFWIRVIHAAGMVSGYTGFPYRSVIFNAGCLCVLILGYAVFATRF